MVPPDIQDLQDQFDAAERDARAVVAGVSAEQGVARVKPGSWSIAECLDHLAVANRVYLNAMRGPAERARARGSRKSRPARPGLLGGWFVWSMEPPVKKWIWMPRPRKITPRVAPPLADAFTVFLTAHGELRSFLKTYAGIDLARVRFANPFIPGIYFSLATGLHVITAHERRHLVQAWNVRRALENFTGVRQRN